MILFIAEIGINHNGDVNIAKQLIKIAKEIGFKTRLFTTSFILISEF